MNGDFFIAVLLVCTPYNTTVPANCDTIGVRLELLHVVKIMEIQVMEDQSYLKFNFSYVVNNARYSRWKLEEAPPLIDAERWKMDLDHVKSCIEFNYKYQEYLEAQEAINRCRDDRLPVIKAALKRTRDIQYLYWKLRDINSTSYPSGDRRYALLYLSEAMGEKDYARGMIPPPVPVEYFRAIE